MRTKTTGVATIRRARIERMVRIAPSLTDSAPGHCLQAGSSCLAEGAGAAEEWEGRV